jgi:hypothetical protein
MARFRELWTSDVSGFKSSEPDVGPTRKLRVSIHTAAFHRTQIQSKGANHSTHTELSRHAKLPKQKKRTAQDVNTMNNTFFQTRPDEKERFLAYSKDSHVYRSVSWFETPKAQWSGREQQQPITLIARNEW